MCKLLIWTVEESDRVGAAGWQLQSASSCGGLRCTHLSSPYKGFKQLKWEADRDDWLHNRDVKSIIKKKRNFRKKMKAPQKPKKQRK